jgi:GTPase involved in cell partitioning and DNA repair
MVNNLTENIMHKCIENIIDEHYLMNYFTANKSLQDERNYINKYFKLLVNNLKYEIPEVENYNDFNKNIIIMEKINLNNEEYLELLYKYLIINQVRFSKISQINNNEFEFFLNLVKQLLEEDFKEIENNNKEILKKYKNFLKK